MSRVPRSNPKRLNDTFNGQDSGVGANVTPWVGANVTPVPIKVHQEQGLGLPVCHQTVVTTWPRLQVYDESHMGRKELGIWRTKSGDTCSNVQKGNQIFDLYRCPATRLGRVYCSVGLNSSVKTLRKAIENGLTGSSIRRLQVSECLLIFSHNVSHTSLKSCSLRGRLLQQSGPGDKGIRTTNKPKVHAMP